MNTRLSIFPLYALNSGGEILFPYFSPLETIPQQGNLILLVVVLADVCSMYLCSHFLKMLRLLAWRSGPKAMKKSAKAKQSKENFVVHIQMYVTTLQIT